MNLYRKVMNISQFAIKLFILNIKEFFSSITKH